MMMPEVSVIVPAFNEERYIEETLRSIRKACAALRDRRTEIVVVDDGSRDGTFKLAMPLSDLVVQHPRSYGKGTALHTGCKMAHGRILVFLDADLGATAERFPSLVEPLLLGQSDMVIASLPPVKKKSGFGLVKKLARKGVHRLSGFEPVAPLSGQRAAHRGVLEHIGRFAGGFGVEVGLTIDAVKLGYRVQELDVPFAHRVSGRDIGGWMHRGKQLCAVGGTLWSRWRQPIC
ncbi:glycosyltransferase family 2 protein [Paenibacillus doosanensis]|uniref:Glucosyl-3-phosphoglycerate synthase n=1 Tax=Paenibacillus konkukensis TaxID=2020716 RepID=A0ABY4RKC2_9BACL|nr:MULTISPECIES: glycosyltransferase family 2 protein [Paenibacillus]MCS7461608.1 glycosyltransferase family 2 protein [Paenibacillus doosanensis]UQZ82033.1 Glucosyl-3-phosphoglycerate synthase [Paenibacillus konkukensis]